jgi:Fur family ferric uptake transcriptional regulator
MTLAPRRTRLSFSDLEDVAAAIRVGGGRLSSSRRLVLSALFAADGPVSAEYIAAGLGGQLTVSDLSSVYRNLEHLEELGVVRHVHVGHGPGLYALENDSQREYLVCERCDRVDSVDAARLDPIRAAIHETFGYQARFSHFPIVGLCSTCATDDERPRDRPGAALQARTSDLEHRHSHEHHHGDVAHDHPHTEHAHDHVEHAHEHNHGDRVHAHDHVHQEHLEADHQHTH